MIKHLGLVLCFLVAYHAGRTQDSTSTTLAQTKPADSTSGTKPTLTVRQSFETADAKGEPAAFLLTIPSAAAVSYAIDGGLSLEWEKPKSSNKIVIEYHGNTLIKKQQKNGQFGYSGTFYLKDLAQRSTRTNYILTTTGKYVRDVVNTTGSFLHTTEVGIYSQNPTKRFRFYKPFALPKGSLNQMLFTPSIGYEYQNVFDAKNSEKDSLQGTMFRGMAKARVTYTFRRKITVQVEGKEQEISVPKVQVYVSEALRYDFVNTTKTPVGWHPYFETGIDYILLYDDAADRKFSIGLTYINGENPSQGLARQAYTLLALKFTL